MNDLAAALAAFDGKLTEPLRPMVDDADAAEVLAACDNGDTEVAATWIAKAMIDAGSDRLHPAALVRKLDQVKGWEAQLHILQCVRHAPDAALDHLPLFRELMAAKRTLLRVWALDAFVRIAQVRPELRPEAAKRVQAALSDGPASLKARARHLEALV